MHGLVGIHLDDNGQPYALVRRTPSWTLAASHEVLEMLADPFERTIFDTHQIHSRGSILQRLMTHEAYHGGELAIALGSHGLDPVYIWRADDPLDS